MAVRDVQHAPLAELFSLGGRGAVVTGGATGLGKATVRRLSEAGAGVVIADIDLELAEKTAAELSQSSGRTILAIRCDAADSNSVAAAGDFALQSFGSVDIWVNNAALYPSISIFEMSEEDWDQVMAVNLRGVFVGAREAARHMIAGGRGGVIVNVASQAGFRGVAPGLSAYATSKHGVRGMTRQMAIELAPHDIRVLGVAPSHARTERTEEAIAAMPELLEQIPALSTSRLGRVGVPDDVGRVVLFLCSDMAMFMSGDTLKIDAAEMA